MIADLAAGQRPQAVPLALLAEKDAPGGIGDYCRDGAGNQVHDESLEPDSRYGQALAAVDAGGNVSPVNSAVANLASIPSPSTSVWHLGPIPLRAYALCIVLGIVVCAYITEKRMRSRGGPELAILDIVVWAVPSGIIGARIYHLITSPQPYFGKGGHPIEALYIWNGGLGIWGAIAGGAFGAWMACRRLRIPLTFVADALAPALPIAQGIGRFGNWFNNELYGRRTSLPWGLQVHRQMIDGSAVGGLLPGLYHPTFLYEAIWDFLTAVLVFLLDRKYKFGKGRAFALYVMAYTVGRAWIEYLRIDEANHFLGLRLNDWTALVVFIAALVYFVKVRGPQEILTPKPDEGTETEPVDAEAAVDADPNAESTVDADREAGPDREAVPEAEAAVPEAEAAVPEVETAVPEAETESEVEARARESETGADAPSAAELYGRPAADSATDATEPAADSAATEPAGGPGLDAVPVVEEVTATPAKAARKATPRKAPAKRAAPVKKAVPVKNAVPAATEPIPQKAAPRKAVPRKTAAKKAAPETSTDEAPTNTPAK
jgi:prolipoprotein diacylglyceryl transferase